jgi:hypothetical protein
LISSPSNGATVSSPIQLTASSSGQPPVSMSVYVNNAAVLQEQSVSSIGTALSLAPGTYTIRVQAQYRRSSSTASVSITVPSSPVNTPPPPPPPPPSSVAAQIANDMTGSNEGFPHGVPLSWDWANGPVMGDGNTPPSGWKAATAWGIVYVASQGNPATNTRVNIRNVQFYLLQKSTQRWLLLQNTSTPDGAAYLEDYSGDISKPADVRTEADGTISVAAGGGYNFHFYPQDRASINPSDIGGVVSVFQARLIVGNAALQDDRSSAQYLAGSGADYWPDLVNGMPAGQTVEPAIGGGKMKYVQIKWRSFAMTTMTLAQLQANPPPINLSGILP